MTRWSPVVILVAAVLLADVVVLGTRQPNARPAARAVVPTTLPLPTPIDVDPDASGAVQPPAPGLYRYRNESVTGTATYEWGLRVTVAAGADGSPIYNVQTTPPGTSQTLAFTPSAELQLAYSQVGTTIADEVTCNTAPVVVLQLPLRPAARWATQSTCANLLGDSLVDRREVVVVGRSIQPVGGLNVPVWELVVVSTKTSTPAKGGVRTTRVETSTIDMSARRGLLIRQVVQEGSDPTTIHTDRLVDLRPV